jgi:hypothetical protein
MPEGEGTPVAAPAEPVEPVVAPAEPAAGAPGAPEPAPIDFHKVIGQDGKILEGFKNLLPEDIRHELTLDTYGDVTELVKQHLGLTKMTGKGKVVIPTETSSQIEIDAFRKAVGVPPKSVDYKMDVPEETKEYFDETLMTQARELFHSPVMNLNQKQVDVLWAFEKARIAQAVKQIEDNEQAEYEEAEKTILAEAGEALEDQKHFADKLIADECPDEAKREKLLEAINDNNLRPYLFNFLAGIQRKYRESHDGIPAGESGLAMTPGMMESKAKELQATPGYMDGTMKNNNPEGYKRLTEEITGLFNRASRAVPKQ